MFRTEEALFFSGQCSEKDAYFRLTLSEDSGNFESDSDAGCIIVCSGCIAGGIHDIGDAGVVMPTDDDPVVWVLGANDFGVDIGDGRWFIDALPFWFQPRVFLDSKVATVALQAPDKPVCCRIRANCSRQCMPCRK